jgi:RHS repeat-associated protein
VVKEVLYDSFGRILEDTNPGMRVLLGFGGGLHDRDLGPYGLVRLGWRDYDPETGRFTAKDPIGLAGGDPDLYGYCLDDPVNLKDPEGLKTASISPGLLLPSPDAHPVFHPGTPENDAFVGSATGILEGAWNGVEKAWGQLGDWSQETWEEIKPKPVEKFESYESVDYSPSHHNSNHETTIGVTPPLLFPDGDFDALDPYKAEHTKNKRPSNKKKHEEGQARQQVDDGGEKGDKRRIRYRKQK